MTGRHHAACFLLCALLAPGCVGVGRSGSGAPQSASAAARVGAEPHPLVLAYRESLRTFLDEDEGRALDALDWSGTERGDLERLRWLAADRAVRRMLPLLLEAEARAAEAREALASAAALRAHAGTLRALPPMLNRDTDAVAHAQVERAMESLSRVRRGEEAIRASPEASSAPPAEAEESADFALSDVPAEPSEPRDRELDVEAEAELADALAQYAIAWSRTHGVSSLHGAAAAAAVGDVVDVAFFVGHALERGVGRDALVAEALGLADELCEAARRRERVPAIRRETRALEPDVASP